MQINQFIIAAILPLLTIASPVENAVLAAQSVQGGPLACTHRHDGIAPFDNKVTKDCCHHVHQDRGIKNVYFNEADKTCMGIGGWVDNAVDTGRMIDCCASRNSGTWVTQRDNPQDVLNMVKQALALRGRRGP
jgi:hypothetical protein